MPTFIVKPKADEDFYVAWSTIVDAPTTYGTREEISRDPHARASAERLARADEYGTSMMCPALPRDEQWFGWHDDSFLVGEVSIPNRREGGAYYVSRCNIRALCEREAAGEDPTDLLTFEPDTSGGT